MIQEAALVQSSQCQRPVLVLLAVLVVRLAVGGPLLAPDSEMARLSSDPLEASVPCRTEK